MRFDGEGFLALDFLMLAATYAATAVNVYLALVPGYVRRGSDMLFRRMLAVYFVGTSLHLTAFLVRFDYDLPTTPQYAVLQILLCVATAGTAIKRVRRKHQWRRRPDGAAPHSTRFDPHDPPFL